MAPIYEIVFSTKGSYQKLADILGFDLNNLWPTETVRNLEASYLRFYSIFMDKGGYKLNISPGDAFLRYLQTYPLDSLLDRSRNVLENRVSLMWNEILSNASKQLVLKDVPDDKTHDFNKEIYTEAY